MSIANIALNHGTLVIKGELTRHSIANINAKDYASWFEHGAVKVNLKQVTKADTAGLAWMFYLLEHAENNACQLSFINLPLKLTKLITLSGVDGLLPLTCD